LIWMLTRILISEMLVISGRASWSEASEIIANQISGVHILSHGKL